MCRRENFVKINKHVGWKKSAGRKTYQYSIKMYAGKVNLIELVERIISGKVK